MNNNNVQSNSAVFSKSTDADTWLEEQLKNVPAENIIEKGVKYNENCGDRDYTASYKIKKS